MIRSATGFDESCRQALVPRLIVRSGIVEAGNLDGEAERPPYAEVPRTPQAVADGIWQRVVTLPCSAGLTEAEQEKVISQVVRVMG